MVYLVISLVIIAALYFWLSGDDDEILVTKDSDYYINKLHELCLPDRIDDIRIHKCLVVDDLSRYCEKAFKLLKDESVVNVSHEGVHKQINKRDIVKAMFIAERMKCLDIDYVYDGFKADGKITESWEQTLFLCIKNITNIDDLTFMYLNVIVIFVENNKNNMLLLNNDIIDFNEILNDPETMKVNRVAYDNVAKDIFNMEISDIDNVDVDLFRVDTESIIKTAILIALIAVLRLKFKVDNSGKLDSFSVATYINRVRNLFLFMCNNIDYLLDENSDVVSQQFNRVLLRLGWDKGL